LESGGKVRYLPKGRRWRLAFTMLIMLVAALFFFEWLGSERPQKMVEIVVQPAATAAGEGKSAKD
jgi:lipopolysaccharide export system protein LptC